MGVGLQHGPLLRRWGSGCRGNGRSVDIGIHFCDGKNIFCLRTEETAGGSTDLTSCESKYLVVGDS